MKRKQKPWPDCVTSACEATFLAEGHVGPPWTDDDVVALAIGIGVSVVQKRRTTTGCGAGFTTLWGSTLTKRTPQTTFGRQSAPAKGTPLEDLRRGVHGRPSTRP